MFNSTNLSLIGTLKITLKGTPFYLDWQQHAHILLNLSRVGRKITHSEASHS